MQFFPLSPISRRMVALSAVGLIFSAPVFAQGFAGSGLTTVAATSSAEPATTSVTTTKPSWHETAVPAEKEISAKVVDGVFTVDGLVAKVQLNYEIHHAGYLYFFVPGVGTAVVSRVEMYGSTKVKDAFKGSQLAFSTGGHSFELTGRTPLVDGRNGRADAYVRLDTTTTGLDRYPMVGYGSTTRAPYEWPLSGVAQKDTTAHFVTPPPLPKSVLPKTVAGSK